MQSCCSKITVIDSGATCTVLMTIMVCACANSLLHLLVYKIPIPRQSYPKNLDSFYNTTRGWLGGAMVLGKLPVPGRPTIWIIVGQGPIALAVGAGGVVWTFLLSSVLSLLFLPLFGRRSDID